MDNLLTRHRNVSILVAVLFAQVLGLAVQVRRSSSGEDTRLIRIWAVEVVTPVEKGVAWIQNTSGGIFHNYIYLRGVRAENRQLKQQIEDMRLQQVRLAEDAGQARRLQLLLGFKEKFIEKTVPAQVIGTSGTEQSRSVYIDKGSADGVKPDQAVITAEGVVGKILHVYDEHTSNILLVNDPSSGVGVILEKSRLQGILRGASNGQLVVEKIMSDESIQPGERVLTSGGDQIFPKGLDVGVVTSVKPGKDSFLDVRVKTGSNLSKLEEVLVITQIKDRSPAVDTAGPVRAIDILTQRLPFVPEKPAADPKTPPGTAPSTPGSTAKPATAQATGQQSKPSLPGTSLQAKPASPTAQVKKSTIPAPDNSADPKPSTAAAEGTPVPSRPGTASADPTNHPAGQKPAAIKTTAVTPAEGAVKPAVIQNPASKKPASPAASVTDKSASPAAQPKPPAAPVEDKPE
jgi:rod shape-determining protein MreC